MKILSDKESALPHFKEKEKFVKRKKNFTHGEYVLEIMAKGSKRLIQLKMAK